jgi:chromatin structure-remodeling complex subunit RSC1/2
MLVLPSGADNTPAAPPVLGRGGLQNEYGISQRTRWLPLTPFVGHFADHPLDDIIEKIACQFTARHIRGRPRPPVWYPGFPLYVCDSRYNDRERIFVKIKNWNSCVPEEVRKNPDFMPIYPFEVPVFPRRYPSPFLTGGRGTGGLGESLEKGEGEKHEGGGIGRKRPRKGAGGATTVSQTDYAGPSRGVYVGPPTPATTGPASTSLLSVPLTATTSTGTVSTPVYQYQPSLATQPQRTLSSQGGKTNEDRSMLSAVGGLSVVGSQNVILEKLPPETGECLLLCTKGL